MFKIIKEEVNNREKFQEILDKNDIKFPFYCIAVDKHHPIDRTLNWYTKLFRMNGEEFIGCTDFRIDFTNYLEDMFKNTFMGIRKFKTENAAEKHKQSIERYHWDITLEVRKINSVDDLIGRFD